MRFPKKKKNLEYETFYDMLLMAIKTIYGH